MRIAPWPDYKGNPIHEGDTIIHPSGEEGRVVFVEGREIPGDAWRVDYGTGATSALCLQIGWKGMAVVEPFETPTPTNPTAN